MSTPETETAPPVEQERFVLPPHYVRKALSIYWTGQGHSTERVWIVYDKATNRHIAEGDSIKEARQNAREVLQRRQNTE